MSTVPSVYRRSAPLTRRRGLSGVFHCVIDGCPYAAFRWETPPITRSSVDRPFEFVLLDSLELETKPDQMLLWSTSPPERVSMSSHFQT